jgi:leucyl aminopeptidase
MVELKPVNLSDTKVDVLAVPVCEDLEIHANKIVLALETAAKSYPEFKGKDGDRITLLKPEGTRITRVVFFGLGKTEKLEAESFRSFAGKAIRFCIEAGLSSLTIATPSASSIDLQPATLFSALAEGACLANHIFDRYKEEKEKEAVNKTTLTATAAQKKAYGRLLQSVSDICAASILAREWVTTPSNDKRPEAFAALLQKDAKAEGLNVSVKTHTWLEKQKFGAMLAVGQGSSAKPRLVTIEYVPKNAKKTLVLVGKGVTFDSGGLNLKPTGSIETMKMDMSGAAAVAGTLMAIAKIKPSVRVIGVMPLVENMPSGTAIRPGDIVRSYSGKTVEIGNTDAEGRLILIDAMAWAVNQYKPDTLIDLATLTGACVVALGEKIAGVFSNDRQLADTLVTSGTNTHERCWALPLPDDYKEMLKNDFADLNNISGGRWAGAITAALFLSEFVGETRWAHIDIAGPAWAAKASDYCGAGGTGFGVRLLCDWIQNQY